MIRLSFKFTFEFLNVKIDTTLLSKYFDQLLQAFTSVLQREKKVFPKLNRELLLLLNIYHLVVLYSTHYA